MTSYINLSSVCLLPKVLMGNTPQYLRQMKSDLNETWHEDGGGIKQAPKKFGTVTCTHAHARCVNVRAHFYILQLVFNSAEFGGDEENKSFSEGSYVYSQ